MTVGSSPPRLARKKHRLVLEEPIAFKADVASPSSPICLLPRSPGTTSVASGTEEIEKVRCDRCHLCPMGLAYRAVPGSELTPGRPGVDRRQEHDPGPRFLFQTRPVFVTANALWLESVTFGGGTAGHA